MPRTRYCTISNMRLARIAAGLLADHPQINQVVGSHAALAGASFCSAASATVDASSQQQPDAVVQQAEHTSPPRTHRRVMKKELMRSPQPPASSGLMQQVAGAADADHNHLQASDAEVLHHHALTGSMYHKLSADTHDFIRLLRRHNSSLPSLPGQVVLARILHFQGDRAYVDAGFHSLSELYRPDLGISHVQSPSPAAPLSSRVGTSDVRIGDVIKVKIEALYTPYGDMQLQPAQQDVAVELSARWASLVEKAEARQPVQGRVLNQCRGGYAVGVAGFVGLLPYAQASSVTCQRIGTLESFYIERLHGPSRTLVLSDARLARAGRNTPKPPAEGTNAA